VTAEFSLTEMTGFATLRPTSGHSYFWPSPYENQLVLYFL